jgi:hypothetical protein
MHYVTFCISRFRATGTAQAQRTAVGEWGRSTATLFQFSRRRRIGDSVCSYGPLHTVGNGWQTLEGLALEASWWDWCRRHGIFVFKYGKLSLDKTLNDPPFNKDMPRRISILYPTGQHLNYIV